MSNNKHVFRAYFVGMNKYLLACILVTCLVMGKSTFATQELQLSEIIQTLEEEFQEGRTTLTNLISNKETNDPDKEIETLKGVLSKATQRVITLSEWDIEEIKEKAEENYKVMIKGIDNYLQLVGDDGIVNRAAIKIRNSAMSLEREFRTKENSAITERSKQSYKELADKMGKYATSVDGLWSAIRQERATVEQTLILLRESEKLYVDRKRAAGVENAVKELEAVHNDLKKLSEAMKKVHEAISEGF